MFISTFHELDMIVLTNWLRYFVTTSIVIWSSNTISFPHECLVSKHFVFKFCEPLTSLQLSFSICPISLGPIGPCTWILKSDPSTLFLSNGHIFLPWHQLAEDRPSGQVLSMFAEQPTLSAVINQLGWKSCGCLWYIFHPWLIHACICACRH